MKKILFLICFLMCFSCFAVADETRVDGGLIETYEKITVKNGGIFMGGYQVTASEWEFVDGQDQAVDTTASPSFVSVVCTGAGDVELGSEANQVDLSFLNDTGVIKGAKNLWIMPDLITDLVRIGTSTDYLGIIPDPANNDTLQIYTKDAAGYIAFNTGSTLFYSAVQIFNGKSVYWKSADEGEYFLITMGDNDATMAAGGTNDRNLIINMDAAGAEVQFNDETVFVPSATQTIDEVGDAILANATNIIISNTTGGSLTLTSTPTIANGTAGQIIIIENVGTQNIVIQDQDTLGSSNLQLTGVSITLTPNDNVMMKFNGTISDWMQLTPVSAL
uniref:Uncharacterized protein n=1 Tax=viral metagenome TaxID=1070528 RepID=A0A6M3IT10_9ZZZZ